MPWLLRGIASGGGGWGSFSNSSVPVFSSFSCWLGMVRVSTVSSRSRQKGPVSVTSANGMAE